VDCWNSTAANFRTRKRQTLERACLRPRSRGRHRRLLVSTQLAPRRSGRAAFSARWECAAQPASDAGCDVRLHCNMSHMTSLCTDALLRPGTGDAVTLCDEFLPTILGDKPWSANAASRGEQQGNRTTAEFGSLLSWGDFQRCAQFPTSRMSCQRCSDDVSRARLEMPGTGDDKAAFEGAAPHYAAKAELDLHRDDGVLDTALRLHIPETGDGSAATLHGRDPLVRQLANTARAVHGSIPADADALQKEKTASMLDITRRARSGRTV
jgi:hypothetical protein